jgi:hypothetical protein
MDNFFTSITLFNGDKISIVEIATHNYMRAINSQATYNSKIDDELDHLPLQTFAIQQICYINNKRQSIDYFFNLDIADYMLICDAVEAMFTKVPKHL